MKYLSCLISCLVLISPLVPLHGSITHSGVICCPDTPLLHLTLSYAFAPHTSVPHILRCWDQFYPTTLHFVAQGFFSLDGHHRHLSPRQSLIISSVVEYLQPLPNASEIYFRRASFFLGSRLMFWIIDRFQDSSKHTIHICVAGTQSTRVAEKWIIFKLSTNNKAVYNQCNAMMVG